MARFGGLAASDLATVWQVSVTPAVAEGAVQGVALMAGAVSDEAAHPSGSAAELVVSYDSVAPQASLSWLVGAATNLASVTAAVEFDEFVTGIAAAGVEAAGYASVQSVAPGRVGRQRRERQRGPRPTRA